MPRATISLNNAKESLRSHLFQRRLGCAAQALASGPATRSNQHSSIHLASSCRRPTPRLDSLSSAPLLRELVCSSTSRVSARATSLRPFSHTARRPSYKTVEEAKSRGRLGVILSITPQQALLRGVLFLIAGAGIILYFREERARLDRKRIAEQNKGIGKPKVGGPFELIDDEGRPFSDRDLKGKYALVYFGFTHCPDICPDELDKMADMIDRVKAACGDHVLTPVMITCDPARDTPAVLKPYLREFHPDIIGLTGDYDAIKDVCKAYRVYFSTPPHVKPGEDYLVDHSIYFYLMDPDGDFVEALGRNFTAQQAAQVMIDHIKDWPGKLDRTPRRRVES